MFRSKSFTVLAILLVASIVTAGAVWWFTRRDATFWGNELNISNGYWLHPTNEHLTDFWYLDNYSGNVTAIRRESEFAPPYEIDVQLATVGLLTDFVDRQVTVPLPQKSLSMGFTVVDPMEVPPTLVLPYSTWVEYLRVGAEVNLQIAKSTSTGETFISSAFLVLPQIGDGQIN